MKDQTENEVPAVKKTVARKKPIQKGFANTITAEQRKDMEQYGHYAALSLDDAKRYFGIE